MMVFLDVLNSRDVASVSCRAQAYPRKACSAGWWHSPSTPSTTSEEMASSPLYAPAMRQSEARQSSPPGLPREWTCSRVTARWLKIASRQPAAASLAVRYVSVSEHESDLKPTASVHDGKDRPPSWLSSPQTSKTVTLPPAEAPICSSRRRSSPAPAAISDAQSSTASTT